MRLVRDLILPSILSLFYLVLGTSIDSCSASDNPPGILYSSLLNGVTLNERSAELRLTGIQAVFLPEPTSSDVWKYNPTDGKLTARLSTKTGKQLAEYRFYAQKLKGVFWQLGGYQVKTTAGGDQDIKLTSAGDYVLEFAVDDNPFFEFPFAVSVKESGDEFDPQKRYHLEGAWSKMGYLFYAEANPKSSIAFKIWLRDKNKTDAYRSDKVDVKVIRTEGNKVVAVSGTQSNGTTYQLKPNWTRYAFQLHTPKTISPMHAEAILNKDGDYKMLVAVNGNAPSEFSFSVANGKIEKAGRQVKEKTDPKRYVQGGRDAWWLEAMVAAKK